MSYMIKHGNGRKSEIEIETYDEACAIVRAEYGEAEIGHDGDLQDGGDRTLCWTDEESARNDPGAHAVCEIRREEVRS